MIRVLVRGYTFQTFPLFFYIITFNFIKFSKGKAQCIWSMGTACRVYPNSLAIKSRWLHFGFGTELSIFMENEYDPAKQKWQRLIQ